MPTDKGSPTSTATRGLCAVCLHAADCALRRMVEGPVYHCEEFAGRTAPAPHPAAAAEPRRPGLGEYRGLCRTCSRRADCAYPKPEGGVWHCEEYE
jgi:hypothetical protein